MSAIDRIRRLLSLLERLQSGQMYNARELAEFCGVSRRTTFRDIKSLQDSGIQVLYDASKCGYWIPTSNLLPPTDFTLEETLSLILLAQELGEPQTGVPFQECARDAALKLLSNLPNHLRQRVGEIASSVRIVTEPRAAMDNGREHHERFLEALTAHRKIRVRYDSVSDRKVIRTLISPYRLFYQRRGWYVIGRSSLHRSIRTFHIGRIQQSEITDDEYEMPPRFSLLRYFGNAWNMIRERGNRHDVIVRFQPLVARNVAQVTWHKTQRLVWNDDGTLDFHVTVDGLSEISWWISGYADQAEVIQPTKLIELLQERVRRMAEIYGVAKSQKRSPAAN